jgi:hypothetical protein
LFSKVFVGEKRMAVKTFPALIVVYVVFLFNRNEFRFLVYLVLCSCFLYSAEMSKQYGPMENYGERAK